MSRTFGCRAGWLVLSGFLGCARAVPVGTTTTTAATRGIGLADGESCAVDGACASGFCQHPIGFCAAPGVCRAVLPCPERAHDWVGGRCVTAWYDRGVPGLCRMNLEEDVTRPHRFAR